MERETSAKFNDQTKSALDKAENLVTENLAKFEVAMEHLTERMEESSKKIQHVSELIAKQKDEFINIKNRLLTAVDPVMPYFRKTATRVKQNPKSTIWLAACLVGGYFLMNYFNKKSSTALLRKSATPAYGSIGVPH